MEEVSAVEQKARMKISFIGLEIGFDRMQKAVIGGKIGEGGKELDISASQYFTQEKRLPVYSITNSEEVMPYLSENKIEGPDGKILVTDKVMQEFEKYQKEFGV
jgi:hypothetical protein